MVVLGVAASYTMDPPHALLSLHTHGGLLWVGRSGGTLRMVTKC